MQTFGTAATAVGLGIFQLTGTGVLIEVLADDLIDLINGHGLQLFPGVHMHRRTMKRATGSAVITPAGADEVTAGDLKGDEAAACGLDHLGGGGQNGAGHAVPGTDALGKDRNRSAGADLAQDLNDGGGGHSALVADDGMQDKFKQLVSKAPTGDMLTGDKVHLLGEADAHQQGVVIRHMVGQDNVIIRQILRIFPLIAEFQLQKHLDHGLQNTVEYLLFLFQSEHLQMIAPEIR